MPAVRAQPGLQQTDYRRRARRLRAVFCRQPGQLQRSLRHLADQVDHRRNDGDRPPRPLKSVRISRFESIVRSALTERPLRYSRRVTLLKAADVLGIGRFEANLILAIEQNKIEPISLDTQPQAWFPTTPVVVAGLVQSVLIAAAFWIMHA